MSQNSATEILIAMQKSSCRIQLNKLFQEFYNLTHRKLTDQARGMMRRLSRHGSFVGGPSVAAEDLVQDTFVAVWKNYPQFRADAKAESWLYSILYSRYLDMLRLRSGDSQSAAAIARNIAEAHFSLSLAHGISANNEPMVLPSIEDEIDSARLRGACQQVLRRLPERARTVLQLTNMGEVPPRAIAYQLGLSPNAAKIRLHRAQALLRRQIESSNHLVFSEMRAAA